MVPVRRHERGSRHESAFAHTPGVGARSTATKESHVAPRGGQPHPPHTPRTGPTTDAVTRDKRTYGAMSAGWVGAARSTARNESRVAPRWGRNLSSPHAATGAVRKSSPARFRSWSSRFKVSRAADYPTGDRG